MAFGNQFGRSFADVLGQKVVDAINAGAPPQTVATQLREQAKRARNASNYKALMAASGQALTYASQDQAGLINQAGMQNQAFTPSHGATAALGQGIGNAAGNEAGYQGQLGQIAKDEQAATMAAAQRDENSVGNKLKVLYQLHSSNQITKAEYDRLRNILTGGVSESESVSTSFNSGWQGSDGNIYFNPNNVPEGITIIGKAGTVDDTVPTKWIGVQTQAIEAVQNADVEMARISNVLNTIPEDAWSGWFGKGAQTIADITGSQDAAEVWRTQVINLTTSNAISSLPKGPASDKDIALVLKGQIDGFANPEAVKLFTLAIQRMSNYKKRYNQALLEHIETNKTGAGFKPPVYAPKGVDQATVGVVTGDTGRDGEYILPLS